MYQLARSKSDCLKNRIQIILAVSMEKPQQGVEVIVEDLLSLFLEELKYGRYLETTD